TQAMVFYWDGVSSDYNYSVPIEDNYINQALNQNGEIFLVTTGRSLGDTLRKLTQTGSEVVKQLKFKIGGATYKFNMMGGTLSNRNIRYKMDTFQNRLLIGASDSTGKKHFVFAYGASEGALPNAFYQPYSGADTTLSGNIGLVKQIYTGMIYLSWYDGSVYHFYKLSSGNSSNASWKGLYTDAGQRIRINYVKFYFKPLVSGDSVTVSLDTDYGTSNSLGTISYAADGAITSKKFVKNILCHAFRPVISWTAGGTAFSKIVVDFDYIND
ncbi:hypothetical protein DRH27_03670, partial [Candidatus Falkowbacteria bacterium]